MTILRLPVREPSLPAPPETGTPTIALVGNPNAGKTSLFNHLTGLRAKTSNFVGTTVEQRRGPGKVGDKAVEYLDLPGFYSLEAATYEERVARDALLGKLEGAPVPHAFVLILDASNLERNLFLASQVIEIGRPTVVALNMIDIAKRRGITFDVARLADELGCPVVPIVARSGKGLDELREELRVALSLAEPPKVSPSLKGCSSCSGCPYSARYDWAEGVGETCSASARETHGRTTEAIDRVLTHPVVGVLAFLGVMTLVFITIFALADYPMGWIEGFFAEVGTAVGSVLPEGDVQSLVVDGVIGGVGGVLVFLPQICILFFLITLLEDTGYLSRAAFVMDRLMRGVGLPGRAFVPMLSAHACAIPGLMATRVIEDRRDRLVTILVLPLMTCSARLPVYAMVTALLFAGSPLQAGLLFTGAYVLGIVAALGMALLFKRSLLKGDSRPLVMELPSYKVPCLKTALLATWRRAMFFVKKAGTVILVLSIILWALSTYPKLDEANLPAKTAERVAALQTKAETLAAAGDEASLAAAESLQAQADAAISQAAIEYSVAGRAGKAMQPVFAPLGFDWQINVGVLSSFAAREVLVSTLAIVYGVGEDAAEDEATLTETLRGQVHEDGTPVFSVATSLSLLVFFVLAMQCLPTQAVTAKETGSWKWAAFQLGYMTVLAWSAAMVTYQLASLLGY